MKRCLLSFVVNESLDSTLLCLVIIHLAIAAGAIIANASSPTIGQFMGIEEIVLLLRSGDCNILIHIRTLTSVLVKQHGRNTTIMRMASTLPAMEIRKSFTKLRTSLHCFISFDN